VRLFHRIEFHLLLRREERPDLGAGAFHEGVHLLHRLVMDRFHLRLRLVDDRLDLRLLIIGQVEVLAQMLERVPHFVMRTGTVMLVFSARLARFLGLEINQCSQGDSRSHRECDQFSCHCLFVACFSAQ